MFNKKITMVLIIIFFFVAFVPILYFIVMDLGLNPVEVLNPVCVKIRNHLEQEMGNLNYCNVLEDCVEEDVRIKRTMYFGCGYEYLANKNANFSIIRDLSLKYERYCSLRWLPPCFMHPTNLPLIKGGKLIFLDCQEHKCVIEKTTNFSISDCDKVFKDMKIEENISIKLFCYKSVAIMTNDSKLCSKLEHQALIEDCIFSIASSESTT